MYAQAQQTPTEGAEQERTAPQEEEGVVDAEIVDEEKDQKGGAA
jgi:molecular chaperone DnaK